MRHKRLRKLLPAALVAIVLLQLEHRPIAAQNQAWDTSYIVDDSFFALGLNVEVLMEHVPEESDLHELLVNLFQEEMGFDINNLKQFQFVTGGEADGHETNTFEIKLAFAAEQDLEPIMKWVSSRTPHEPATHDGMEYMRSDRPRQPSFYMPDEQTVVLANEVRLLKVMENPTSMGAIVDALHAAEEGTDAVIAFDYNDQLDNMVAKIAEKLDGLPFDLHDIAREAKSGTILVDLDSDTPLSGEVLAKNAEGAERIKRTIDALVALGKIGLPRLRAQMDKEFGGGEAEAEDDRSGVPDMLAVSGKALDAAQAALDGTVVSVDGDRVRIQVNVKGGLVEGTRSMARLLLFGVMDESAVEMELEAIEIIEDE